MKEKLNELLDSIYELEGLVHLALTRDDNPERLPELIAKKGEELARHAAMIAENSLPQEPEAAVDPVVAVEEQPLYVVEQDQTAVAVSSPIEDDMQAVVESVFDSLPEQTDTAGECLEETDDPATEDDEPAQESREPRGKLVFSINDRYRFKRELFNNSDADFNNTLALVASMDGYDEAEDYFLGELQWDSKRGEVIDFLEILKSYFK